MAQLQIEDIENPKWSALQKILPNAGFVYRIWIDEHLSKLSTLVKLLDATEVKRAARYFHQKDHLLHPKCTYSRHCRKRCLQVE